MQHLLMAPNKQAKQAMTDSYRLTLKQEPASTQKKIQE